MTSEQTIIDQIDFLLPEMASSNGPYKVGPLAHADTFRVIERLREEGLAEVLGNQASITAKGRRIAEVGYRAHLLQVEAERIDPFITGKATRRTAWGGLIVNILILLATCVASFTGYRVYVEGKEKDREIAKSKQTLANNKAKQTALHVQPDSLQKHKLATPPLSLRSSSSTPAKNPAPSTKGSAKPKTKQ